MIGVYDIGYIHLARDWLWVSRISIYDERAINAPKLYIGNGDMLTFTPYLQRWKKIVYINGG